MGLFSRGQRAIDWKKLKLSVLLGLGLGIAFATVFSGENNPAAGKEAVTHASGMTDLGSLFSEALDKLETAGSRLAKAPEPELEPTAFLDASMELLSEMAKEKGGAAVVELDGGESLEFTVLPDLQAEIEKQYHRYEPEEAAFVAIDPATGELLALTGYAGGRISQHQALRAEGPAASIFKIITAAALLEEHGVRPKKELCYHGGRSRISKRLLTPDPERDNICHTFSQALGRSANVIFARLAFDKLSRNEMKSFAERFGFNKVIPFVWPVELSKVEVPEDRVEFARMAAGFHHAYLSPLHGALLAAAVANGGEMMRPQVLKRVVSGDGEVMYESRPEKLMTTVDEKTARKLSDMMLTTTREGTARKYFRKRTPAMSKVKVAGKTGSLSRKRGKNRYYYSWFVGFAPADNPRIAFASLVVNGPKWKVKGPYVAQKALESFFANH